MRTINTGLKGKFMLEVLLSVRGQMSDGLWENSSRVQPYYQNLHIDTKSVTDENGFIKEDAPICIEVENCYVYNNMSDLDIRRYLANKVKAIVKKEFEWENHQDKNFNENNVESLRYMGHHIVNDISVKDAYKAYDILRKGGW